MAGYGTHDARLHVFHIHGVVHTVGGGGGEGALFPGEGDGVVIVAHPGAGIGLNTGVLSVVVEGHGEGVVLQQGDVAHQPAAAGAGEGHGCAVRGGGRLLGGLLGGRRGLPGRRCSLCRVRGSGAAGAEEGEVEDQGQHQSHHCHSADFCGELQLYASAAQEDKQCGAQYSGVQHHQHHQPVGRGVCGGGHSHAVGLGVKDVVAGGAHGLLGSVGAAVQIHAHQAEHHVAAGADGQVDVHPGGVAHCRVGDHSAPESPLVAQHIGEQGRAGARPGGAQIAVAAHDGGGAALLDGNLEGAQVQLTHGLFVGPHREGEAVALLVVECKVLGVAVDALAGGAPDGGGGHTAGEEGVLSVVLKVTPGQGGAVEVGAGGVQTHHMVGRGLGAEGASKLLYQLLIPGRADDHFAGEGYAPQAAHQAVDARRAVQLVGGGLAHAGGLGGGPAAVGDHVGHVLHAQLLQQLLPHGVVIVLSGQILQGEAVVGKGDGGIVRVAGVDRGGGEGSHKGVRGRFAVGAAGGQGARPVGPGHIGGDLPIGHIIKLVDSGGIIAGTGVVLVVDDVGVHGVGALVNDLVGIAHQLNLICACLQYIAAVVLVVVGGHVLCGEGNLHRLALAGLEQLGLSKTGQNHMGLFNAADGVGGGVIHLHHVLTGHVAGVCHLDGHGDGAVGVGIPLNFLAEGGVAQAIAEGILDHGLVGLLVALASLIIHPAGFVEPIAHIDALGVFHIVVVQIAVGEAACIPVGGGGGHIVGVGVGEAAGGVDQAAQGLAHGVHTGAARAADPECRVNALVLQEPQLHGMGGVDEHHHGAVALVLDQLEQVLFLLGEGEIAAAVIGGAVPGLIHIGGQIAALAANAGEHDNGHIGELLGLRQHLLGVLGDGHLCGREVGAHISALLGAGYAGALVELHQLFIDNETGVGQTLDEVHVGGGVAGAAAGAAIEGRDGGKAKQVDLGALGQGECVVFVLQEHHAFALQLLGHAQAGLFCLGGAEMLGGDGIAASEQGVQIGGHKGVDGGVELYTHQVDDECDDQQHTHGNGGSSPRRAGNGLLFIHGQFSFTYAPMQWWKKGELHLFDLCSMM